MDSLRADFVHPLTKLFLTLFNLRILLLLAGIWLLVRGPLPDAFVRLQEQIQVQIFRLGLYVSHLPLPQTHITVIHVPDIEYQRWLVDLPGAAELEQLLDKRNESAVFGLILEQPLILIQPTAEGLLREIQQGRRTREHLYQEANDLLSRRERLVESLTSPGVVLGLTDQSSHFYRRIPVNESFAGYPQVLRDWLWPWPEPSPESVVSPLLQYYPIDSAPSQERRLASLEGDKVIPMFPLQFWATSKNFPNPPKVLHWQRDRGFALGVEKVATSVGAEIVPVYGALSGIRASMRQITLGAALAGGELSGWVLVGRDSSATLEQSAQVIASLGDRAFLFEPAWWALAQKMLLIFAAIFLAFGMPMLKLRWIFGVVTGGVAALMSGQILGQTLFDYWLPTGDVLLFGVGGVLVMLLWRWQRNVWLSVHNRADESCLALAFTALKEDRLEDARSHLHHCRTTTATLEALYQIAQHYELKGDFAQALKVFKDLRRRRWHYRDVPQQIKRLRACLIYHQTQEAGEALFDRQTAAD